MQPAVRSPLETGLSTPRVGNWMVSRLGARASTSRGNLSWFALGAGIVARCFDSDEAKWGPGVSLPSLWTKPQSTSFTFGDTYTEDDVPQPYGSS